MAKWSIAAEGVNKVAHGEAHAWRIATAYAHCHPYKSAEVWRNGQLKARLWFDERLQYLEYSSEKEG